MQPKHYLTFNKIVFEKAESKSCVKHLDNKNVCMDDNNRNRYRSKSGYKHKRSRKRKTKNMYKFTYNGSWNMLILGKIDFFDDRSNNSPNYNTTISYPHRWSGHVKDPHFNDIGQERNRVPIAGTWKAGKELKARILVLLQSNPIASHGLQVASTQSKNRKKER